MAIQIGTVDGLITISKDNFNCFISAIHTFSQQGGVAYAVQKGISLGTAFQRYVEPVYTRRTNRFDIASIDTPVHTRAGNEQSPARGTFCRKMGILDINDRSNIFQLTPLALELYRNNITIEEYAFILMTKQGIFNNGIYVQNLFAFIANWFDKNTTLLESDLKSAICGLYGNQDIEKTRIDIILNALSLCKLIVNVGTGKYVLASIPAADIFKDFALHSKNLSQALRDDENNYTDYIGSLDHGIFDIISNKNSHIYSRIYPNLSKYIKQNMDKTHQIIYYGCPGSGKSHHVKEITENVDSNFVFRTTFHPDTDYASFVGCYKPMAEGHNGNYRFKSLQDLKAEANIINSSLGDKVSQIVAFVTKYANDLQYIVDTDPNIKSLQNLLNKNLSFANETYLAYVVDYVLKNQETRITYKFCPQVFTNAYIKAWEDTSKPVYLIIEEINRGNCAQIFGDLFQLLDRDKETGKSEYPIKADKDLVAHIEKVLGAGHEGIKNGELCLPPNLIIYATMNTSDQSLFPMDSAFKRRWDWEYVPIEYGQKKSNNEDNDSYNFIIKIGGNKYKWIKFLRKVNDKIYDTTLSEDKQMGNYFIKGDVDELQFVNKVMFYLWNEVCKEEYKTQRNFFRKGKAKDNEECQEFKFVDLFTAEEGKDLEQTRADILTQFMAHLEVNPESKGENSEPTNNEQQEE